MGIRHAVTALLAVLVLAVPASASAAPSIRGGRLLPHHPAHRNQKSRRRNAESRRSAENRNENRHRGRALRRQGRAPQPADRRPDRHRTGLLPGRHLDRLRPRRPPLLGPRRRLRAAAADQRLRRSTRSRWSPRTGGSSSSSAAPRRAAPADLYTVRSHGGGLHPLTSGAADDHDADFSADGKAIVFVRTRRRQRRHLLGPPERRQAGAADPDRRHRRVRATLLRRRHPLQPRRQQRHPGRLRRRLHDGAPTAPR